MSDSSADFCIITDDKRPTYRKWRRKMSQKEKQVIWDRASHFFYFFCAFLVVACYIIFIFVSKDKPTKTVFLYTVFAFIPLEITFICVGISERKNNKKKKKPGTINEDPYYDYLFESRRKKKESKNNFD